MQEIRSRQSTKTARLYSSVQPPSFRLTVHKKAKERASLGGWFHRDIQKISMSTRLECAVRFSICSMRIMMFSMIRAYEHHDAIMCKIVHLHRSRQFTQRQRRIYVRNGHRQSYCIRSTRMTRIAVFQTQTLHSYNKGRKTQTYVETRSRRKIQV